MLIVGLTGTFGSGKSTVAALFGECGAGVIDADAIAHQVVEPGTPALEEIRCAFGEEFITEGRLDRRKMAAHVFTSPAQRGILEAIVHPRVSQEMVRQVEAYRASFLATGKPPVAILNIPLLYESRLTGMVDKTVVVTVSEGARFHRVRVRDGMNEQQVVQRLAAQWPQRAKAALADYTVDNSGSIESTRSQVCRLYQDWLNETSR